MTALLQDIKGWIARAQAGGATHMIVVCDTYDHDDFPVFVSADEDVREVEARMLRPNGSQTTFGGRGPQTTTWCSQKIMEVYSLTGNHTIESQLSERRAFHYD